MASPRNGNRSKSRRFLPPDPRTESPYRVTTQIAVRLGVLGAIAIGAFAVLFLRLWALQVLSGDQYLRTAQNNQLRTVRVAAPRGQILDRNGRPLVTNKAGTGLQLWPADLPKDRPTRLKELRALAKITNVPIGQIAAQIRRRKGDPLTPVTVRYSIREDQVAYLLEHRSEFPGVAIATTYLRQYPYSELAAQLLGYVTEISPDQLKRSRSEGLRPGDKIGQSGLEAQYDSYLRGRPGLRRLRVDSLGRPQSSFLPSANPQEGHTLRLTIDVKLQRAAEDAIRYGIQLGRNDGRWAADGGSIVAMDPRDGSILAMASNPTYNPAVFVGRIKTEKLAGAGLTKATAPEMNFPAINRAVDANYPPGSTFKPLTAIAGMQEHLIEPYGTKPCTGSYTIRGENGVDYVFNNWDPFVNEAMSLPTALARSCDTYFYQVGWDFYGLPPSAGHPFQAWASRFGFGFRTGVDLAGESSGLLPTPEWRKTTFKDPIDRLWKPGDSIQLAIGQKDLLATPLQMTRFYAAIANGGRLVTPHLVQQVEQPGTNGTASVPLRTFTPPAPQRTNVDPQALEIVKDGLWQATHAPLGTGYGVFGSFPISIAGKTGTAEKDVDLGDGVVRNLAQAWWCGYGPSDNPTIVVCALIENGGHGGAAAAPAALKVFEEYFGEQAPSMVQVNTD
ncbi:MAG: penicillin-binding protein 2 [Actinomycetota bacterium]|nr:penicillin-binding protein 2 [Actinomycetota bacterium]